MSWALAATHEPSCGTPGLPNSSRVAVIVDDTGFHSATTPSHPGMCSGAVKPLDTNPSGQTRICTTTAASGVRSTSPR